MVCLAGEQVPTRPVVPYPGVVEDVLGGEPELGQQLEHALYQLLGQGGDAAPVLVGEVVLAGQNAIEEFLLVVVLADERRVAAEEDVKDHTGSPHIDLQNRKYGS